MPYRGHGSVQSAAALVKPVNATLGVPGLPQSGTGQTTLLTGRNAPRLVGRHFGPYPYSTLRGLLAEYGIFRRLAERGKSVIFANAFPHQYFSYLEKHPGRVTATTQSWLAAGFPLNGAAELRGGNALSADITNQRWHRLGYPDMPVITPQTGGRRLATLAQRYDFVFYEYFYTDHAGHRQSMEEAVRILELLDEFLEGILDEWNPRDMLLLLTSDHGNLEDLSVRTHTRNPVPLVAAGRGHDRFARPITRLTHIIPRILDVVG